ncbi:MAG: acyl-CoA dehydrogenase family protein, partial [Chloroflexota bacterium]
VRSFAIKELAPLAAGIDADARFPIELLPKMASLGLLGMTIPDEFGGSELDAVGISLAISEIGRICGSTGLSLAAHVGLGCYPISRWGTIEQKKLWLPSLAAGRSLGALCLTEPDAGSDLRGIRTTAKRVSGGYILNGSKAWITNPSLSDVLIVFARHSDAHTEYSLLLVPTSESGVDIGPPETKMGARGSPTHSVTLADVFLPETAILGTEGKGLSHTLEILDGGRISIGALSVGIARGALEQAVGYAKSRTAFGRTLTSFQAIQWMIADAATEIEAATLLVYQASVLKDQGLPFSRQAAMAKLFASEAAERVTRNAIQIFGSYGYSKEFPVERMYRDARLMTIGEGTSEIQRVVISRGVIKEG